MFEIFAGKLRSFKERFFLVRPKSEAALNTLLDVMKGGVCRPLFPLYRTVPNLTKEEIDAHQKLWAFVQSFMRKVKTNKRGNPSMNADGTPVTKPRFINTHDLVVFEDPDDCLCSCIFLYFI